MLGKMLTKKGWREIAGKRYYFKSKWEANYARFLEWQSQRKYLKAWEYEPETFWFKGIKRGCVSYLPDFKLIWPDDTFEYHEIKGWMDAKSNTKLKRMQKYYPDVKVLVIGKKEYRDLENMLYRLVPEWEK